VSQCQRYHRGHRENPTVWLGELGVLGSDPQTETVKTGSEGLLRAALRFFAVAGSYGAALKVPGSSTAFFTTSSSTINFVSPLANVIFIADISSVERSTHRSSPASVSRICLRFGTIVT